MLEFGLGLIVDGVRHAWRTWKKPRLCVQEVGSGHVLLDHHVEASSGQVLREIIYGFEVQNQGRSVARGVQAFLVQTEIRDRDETQFRQISAHTSALPWYGAVPDVHPVVLVRKGSVTVKLAYWQEGWFAVMPASGIVEEHYDDICAEVAQFRFTVAVIEDGGEDALHSFTINNPSRRSRSVARANVAVPASLGGRLARDCSTEPGARSVL